MIKKWTPKHREVAFKKYSRVVEKVDFELPNGNIADFYLYSEKPAVAVVALTPDNQVIMVRQYRPGPDEIFLELPGGYVDPGEDRLTAGLRELREETGYTSELGKHVATLYDSAYSTMRRSVVVATDCVLNHDQELDENEDCEVVLVSVSEFLEILRSGHNTDIEVGYRALDYLGLLKPTF